MLTTTFDAIRSVLKADPSINPPRRNQLLALLRDRGAKPAEAVSGVADASLRLLRTAEVARRLGYSTRTVHNLAKTGVIKKFRLPGRKRASGFLESDVVALLQGGTD